MVHRIEVYEKYSSIEEYVLKLRHQLTPSGQSEQQLTTAATRVIQLLSQLSQQLYQAIKDLNQPSISQTPINNDQPQQNKILLYYFQLLNLTLIHLKTQQSFSHLLKVSNLHNISNHFSKLSFQYHSKTFKALLIFYFNVLKKLSQLSNITSNIESSLLPTNILSKMQINIQTNLSQKTQSSILQNECLFFQLLQNILHIYFQSNHQHNHGQNQIKFKQQTEWIAMIFQLLPTIKWNQIYKNFTNSFLSNYFTYLQILIHQEKVINQQKIRKDEFNILHMLGNFLNLVIQSRTSTELIKGYECQIEDVNKIYSNPSTNTICSLKLNQSDVLFICELLIKYYNQQKCIFREMFINKDESVKNGKFLPDELVSTRAESENEDFHKIFRQICEKQGDNVTKGELILETINVLNSIVFLGGYNPQLQQIIYHALFKNNTLPEFLELSYLIYNQRRFMSKYNIKLNMSKPPDTNLSKILNIEYETINNDERRNIFKLIGLEVKFGQLSVLLRLMTNLVHINSKALGYFEDNIKYLHLVMSLTHQSQINLTMKNWAVLFIKNCCDSKKLREQISQVKIEMKVDQ